MAIADLSSRLQIKRVDTGRNATWLMSIAAAALALVIGLSAVDIQRQRVADTEQTTTGAADGSHLDGRGKWAGYM